ncbi:DUF2188 domain-containing protein [Shouchella sp. 1P09AA]|uniref:DUF2188 domain-containing protein n=1 Tax=Bacillaceae TaxID=186817 RepID=UPI000C06DF70|nr:MULTISPECIES: DUF2188 domain-containing protein [Bacillaceae]UTR08070.1 DUF2188 domain-containing protein [Alkalihalobacillus sp. LMS6]
MKEYTVTPNKDATTWFVKIEDIAPHEEYDKQAKAIEAGEKLAKENQPSRLIIFDEYHDQQEIRTY